jgi:hypothetical protein
LRYLKILLLVLLLAVPAAALDPDERIRRFHAETVAVIDSLDPSADRIAYEASRVACEWRLKRTIGLLGAPERYVQNARWLLAELHEAAPLPRLSHKMEAIRRKLEVGDTGREVQDEQARLVEDLDRLIERMREREGEQRPSAWGDLPSNGKAKLGKAQVASRREWAKAALRQPEALQSLSGRFQFPGFYRDLVEQYWKALARDSAAEPKPPR